VPSPRRPRCHRRARRRAESGLRLRRARETQQRASWRPGQQAPSRGRVANGRYWI